VPGRRNPVLEAARTARNEIYVQFWRFWILHSVLLRADRVIEWAAAANEWLLWSDS